MTNHVERRGRTTSGARHALILAPAKVNLSLRIVGRRNDGYHLLETLMYPVSLFDRIEIAVRRVGCARSAVRCSVNGREVVPRGGANLAARAARVVLRELSTTAEIDLRVVKVIPVGAGLGGGSSDAAAVLAALPPLLGRRITASRLGDVAAMLGADVPFFLSCRPAWATGIGERLAPLIEPARLDLVVVVPKARVSTAWAYANALPPLSRLRSRPRGRMPSSGLLPTSKSLSCGVSNDFQPGVASFVPDVVRLKQRLESVGAMATVMSGSGSAMVGVFASRGAAERAAREFRGADRAWAVRSLTRRPRSGE